MGTFYPTKLKKVEPKGNMPGDSFDDAYRSALLSFAPKYRPLLWQFLPVLLAHWHMQLEENYLLEHYGDLDTHDA